MTRYAGDLILKDPDSIEPQGFDWTDYLDELGAGVLINTSVWSVDPATGTTPLTISGQAIVTGNLKTTALLTGGDHGVRYEVTNRITTNGLPVVTDDRSFFVVVEQR